MGIRSSLTLGDDLGLRPIANNLGGFPGLHLPTELTEACGGFGGGFGPGFDNCLVTENRYITEFGTLTGQYIEIPEHTSSGDFRHALKLNVSLNTMSAGGGGSGSWISFTGGGNIQVKASNTFLDTVGLGLVDDDKQHELVIHRVGSVTTIYWDGAPVGSGSMSGDMVIDRIASIGAGFESQYHKGNLSDVDLNGERFYPIDETWINSNVVKDTLTVLGSEEVTNGDFATDSDWTKGGGWSTSGGKASYNGSRSGARYLYQDLAIVVGKEYLLEFDVLERTGSQDNVIFAGNGNSISLCNKNCRYCLSNRSSIHVDCRPKGKNKACYIW